MCPCHLSHHVEQLVRPLLYQCARLLVALLHTFCRCDWVRWHKHRHRPYNRAKQGNVCGVGAESQGLKVEMGDIVSSRLYQTVLVLVPDCARL